MTEKAYHEIRLERTEISEDLMLVGWLVGYYFCDDSLVSFFTFFVSLYVSLYVTLLSRTATLLCVALRYVYVWSVNSFVIVLFVIGSAIRSELGFRTRISNLPASESVSDSVGVVCLSSSSTSSSSSPMACKFVCVMIR